MTSTCAWQYVMFVLIHCDESYDVNSLQYVSLKGIDNNNDKNQTIILP